MGSQVEDSNTSNAMQRVKVYCLNNDGKWDDHGTGHATADYLETPKDLVLLVIDEEDKNTILAHRITSDDIYTRDEDTKICWRDPDLSIELALSFEKASGCSYIWDHICEAQRMCHFNNSHGNLDVASPPTVEAIHASYALQSDDESSDEVNSEMRELPSVELSTLPLDLKTVVDCGIIDQLHENGKTKYSDNVAESRNRVDVRGVEKKEDYFNEDRPGTCAPEVYEDYYPKELEDCEGDEDKDDYYPKKAELSFRSEEASNSSRRPKCISAADNKYEEFGGIKKQRLNQHLTDASLQ